MSSFNLSKNIDGISTYKTKPKYVEPVERTVQINETRINIDSRHRNKESKNILDSNPINLGLNPITILNRSDNNSEMIIHHPNHDYNINDNIIVQGIQSATVSVSNGVTFIAASSYAKIQHKNHGLNSKTLNDITITITGFRGNKNNETEYNNIPINKINNLHKIYFTKSEKEIENNDYYYIRLDNIISDFSELYTLSPIIISFDNINGIKLNLLNADYPISVNQMQGYHIITSITDDTYTVPLHISNNIDIYFKGGSNVSTAKVGEFIEGYEDNNNYKIPFKRTFVNVTRIKLLSTEFPNTEKVIKSSPSNKKNNMFRWKLENDGLTEYSVELEHGNYSIQLLEESLVNSIKQIFRDTLRIKNKNNSLYTYYEYHDCEITIEPRTDKFMIEFFDTIFYPKAITYKSNISFTDGTGRLVITHPSHRLEIGSVITIINATATDSIPQDVLNTSYNIEKIIDENTYQIKLPKYNVVSSNAEITNGGSSMGIRYPIKSQLLFNEQDTIGSLIGFRNTGKSNAITNYNYINSNKDLYQNDVVSSESYLNNSINLSGDNYILMSCPIFTDSYNSGDIDHIFAKLLLSDEPGTILYNQYTQMGEKFNPPLKSLSEWEVRFYDANDELYNFGNLEHSYTLEIHERIIK